MFLTPEELSQLTGYQKNQRVKICRWLDEHSIPHEVNRLGEPVVLRSAVESRKPQSVEPDFSWMEA